MKIEGGCYCGAVRYEISGEIKAKSQCHCRECQYFSGGGPNYFALVSKDDFRFTNGKPKSYAKTELEHPVTRHFCEDCGTHLATIRPGLDKVILKAGTLDNPALYGKANAAIFTCDAQNFHHIPDDIPSFEKLPRR